jgi:hypothetical protein
LRDHRFIPAEQYHQLLEVQPNRIALQAYLHPHSTARHLKDSDLAKGCGLHLIHDIASSSDSATAWLKVMAVMLGMASMKNSLE